MWFDHVLVGWFGWSDNKWLLKTCFSETKLLTYIYIYIIYYAASFILLRLFSSHVTITHFVSLVEFRLSLSFLVLLAFASSFCWRASSRPWRSSCFFSSALPLSEYSWRKSVKPLKNCSFSSTPPSLLACNRETHDSGSKGLLVF